MKFSPKDFFSGKYVIPTFDTSFRLYDGTFFDECVQRQTIDFANLEVEDIVYSVDSYRNMRVAKDNNRIYLCDAELKTYPTRFLGKKIAKTVACEFNLDFCLFSMNLYEEKNPIIYDFANDLMIYDTHLGKYLAYEPIDTSKYKCCFLKIHSWNIDNEIAGKANVILCFQNKNQVDVAHLCSSAFIKKLIEDGNSLGYNYIAHSMNRSKTNITLTISYESKWQESEIKIEDSLYHIAPLSSKEKILKYGLCPHGDDEQAILKKIMLMHNKDISKIVHPYRVYLFNGFDLPTMINFVKVSKKMSKLYDKMDKKLNATRNFALFEIDRKKIPHLKLYRDNNFESNDPNHPTALYTYTNISPNAISLKDEIHI